MRWSEIIRNAIRAFFRPSPAMIRAGLVIVAAICVGFLAADRDSTALALVSIAGLLFGLLWFSIAYLDRAGMVHIEDMKLHLALVRDYLKGFVSRDRR